MNFLQNSYVSAHKQSFTGRSHAHHLHIIYGCFHTAKQNSIVTRSYGALKYLLPDSLRKKFADLSSIWMA